MNNKLALAKQNLEIARKNRDSYKELPEMVYNSNAIENSSLTLDDTAKIIMEQPLVAAVSVREIFEAKNHSRFPLAATFGGWFCARRHSIAFRGVVPFALQPKDGEGAVAYNRCCRS